MALILDALAAQVLVLSKLAPLRQSLSLAILNLAFSVCRKQKPSLTAWALLGGEELPIDDHGSAVGEPVMALCAEVLVASARGRC